MTDLIALGRTASEFDILSGWPPELRLLVHLTRARDDGALAAALSSGEGHSFVDWRRFLELAEYHHVECLVALNLTAHKSAKIPHGVREHLTVRLRRNSQYSLALTRLINQVTSALMTDQIPHVLLKGPSISERFYTHPSERQCLDADILIHEHDLFRARSAVEKLGFEQRFPGFVVPDSCESVMKSITHHIAYQCPIDGVWLELHWRLNANPHLLNWRFDEVIGATTRMAVAGKDLLVLDPPAQFIYLSCHGAKHAWSRLKWLADIHRMLGVLTEEQSEEIVQRSRRDGVMRMVSLAFQLARSIYAIPSEEWPQKLLIEAEDRNALRYVLSGIEKPVDTNSIRLKDLSNLYRYRRYSLALRSSIRYKMADIGALFSDVRSIQTIRLSKRWYWLYVLLGPCLAVFRVCKREFGHREM